MEAPKPNDHSVAAAVSQEDTKKSRFFDDVIDPPGWLTQNYVEGALRTYENDPKLKITSYSLKPCTKPGDNFIGVIFRLVVAFESRGVVKSESFIIKIEAFLDGTKKEMVANRPYFETEGGMYLEVLPVMQELLKNIGDTEILAPGLIHYNSKPKILIFKDIAPEGFDMCRMPVPFEKAAQIAVKLGKFHALSYFLKEEQGDTRIETFTNGMFIEKNISDWAFMEQNLTVIIQLMREWGHEAIAEKLDVLKPHFLNKLLEIYKAQPKGEGLNVLNHGDFHIRNLMFRHGDDVNEKSKFEAIRFIDFQCSVYATPAVDLAFLLYLIADSECNENMREQLLMAYHDQFKRTLIDLGYLGPRPTLMDIQKEVLKNGLTELFTATMFLSIFHMDYSEMVGDEFTDPEKMLIVARKIYQKPEMKSILLRVLPQLMYKGILDV